MRLMGIGDRNTFQVTTTAKNGDFNADGGAVLVQLVSADSWDGTVDFQATLDGANFFNIPYYDMAALAPAWSVSQLSTPSTARYILRGPLTQVRIKVGAGTTGTLTVSWRVVDKSDPFLQLMVDGVKLQLDDTDKLAVSLYGRNTNAGDTALRTVGTRTPSEVLLAHMGVYDTTASISHGVYSGAAAGDAYDGSRSPSVVPSLSNGSTFDRQRGNTDRTALASAARTASTNSADLTNYNARGLLVEIDVTVNPGGAETLQVLVQAKHPVSGAYETLLDLAANAFGGSAGNRVGLLYPGAGAAANGVDVVTAYPLPRTYRVRVVHSSTGSWTYSVSVSEIL